MDEKGMTIINLAHEIESRAISLRSRTCSLGDALGGDVPSESGQAETPTGDLHGLLQRIVTILDVTSQELERCEKLTGVSVKVAAAQAPVGSRLRGY